MTEGTTQVDGIRECVRDAANGNSTAAWQRNIVGQGWMSFVYAITNTVGITMIYQDIAIGKNLGLNTFDRWHQGTSGVLQLVISLSLIEEQETRYIHKIQWKQYKNRSFSWRRKTI